MKRGIIGGLIVMLSVLAITSCTSTFTIISDYDKTANYAGYKTYSYLPGADSLMGPGVSRLKSYMEEYMHLLGYVKSDKPDLFISVNGKVQQRVGTTTTGGYGGYGYGGGYYGGYSGWDSYTSTYVDNQTTVIIGLVDVQKHQLVWQAAATGEFDQYSLKDSKLHNMIDEIFGQFPYKAGSSEKRPLLYGKYYKKPTAK